MHFQYFQTAMGIHFYYFFNISTIISKYFKPKRVENLKCLKLVFRHFYLILNHYFKCEYPILSKIKLLRLIKNTVEV